MKSSLIFNLTLYSPAAVGVIRGMWFREQSWEWKGRWRENL